MSDESRIAPECIECEDYRDTCGDGNRCCMASAEKSRECAKTADRITDEEIAESRRVLARIGYMLGGSQLQFLLRLLDEWEDTRARLSYNNSMIGELDAKIIEQQREIERLREVARIIVGAHNLATDHKCPEDRETVCNRFDKCLDCWMAALKKRTEGGE